MATVILVRHGRTTANASGVLAGRTPGVRLDETGTAQVARVGERLADVPLVRVVTSPQERCRQTARGIVGGREDVPGLTVEKGLAECDYGEWQGRPLRDLARTTLWRTVQRQPSAATFPGGESLRAMSARGVEAIRRHDAEVSAEHGPDAVWMAVSHGDVIKAILAEALGSHLDQFQRIHVDPASVSLLRHTDDRPMVLAVNTHGGDLGWLRPPKKKARRSRRSGSDTGDAVVGGGAGPAGS